MGASMCGHSFNLILLALILSGCAHGYEIVLVDTPEQLAQECGNPVLKAYGCYKPRGACEKIIAYRPKHTGDHDALETLGREAFKCATGNTEY